jgi:hypothetical protein
MAFLFKLETTEGVAAEPPTALACAGGQRPRQARTSQDRPYHGK